MTYGSRQHPWNDLLPGVGTVALALWGMMLFGSAGPGVAVGQTTEAEEAELIDRYQAARRRLLVRRHMQHVGPMPVLSPRPLPTPTDSLHPPPPNRRTSTSGEVRFPLQDVRLVHRGSRDWFRERFADVRWSFLGATPQHTFFDTTRTRDLRARLQSRFGDPTQTLADALPDTSRQTQPQFEYWFVVNDSIPVQVTDARGPGGRGLILTAEREYRDRLQALRDTLLAPLRHAERAAYVDLYHDARSERWYRIGFDGQHFFLERTSRTDLVPGRRPRLDSTKTPAPDENSP